MITKLEAKTIKDLNYFMKVFGAHNLNRKQRRTYQTLAVRARRNAAPEFTRTYSDRKLRQLRNYR